MKYKISIVFIFLSTLSAYAQKKDMQLYFDQQNKVFAQVRGYNIKRAQEREKTEKAVYLAVKSVCVYVGINIALKYLEISMH